MFEAFSGVNDCSFLPFGVPRDPFLFIAFLLDLLLLDLNLSLAGVRSFNSDTDFDSVSELNVFFVTDFLYACYGPEAIADPETLLDLRFFMDFFGTLRSRISLSFLHLFLIFMKQLLLLLQLLTHFKKLDKHLLEDKGEGLIFFLIISISFFKPLIFFNF